MTERVPLLLDRIRAAIARDPEAPAFLGSSTISHGAMRSLIGAAIKMLVKSRTISHEHGARIASSKSFISK